MDWPEPPQWLMVIGSIVFAPLWALFLLLWLLHELITGIPSALRYWARGRHHHA